VRVLFDQGTPAPIRRVLTGHTVSTARQMGWDRLANGLLLDAAEAEFDVLVTTDKNIPFQQRVKGRKLAILILPTPSWRRLRDYVSLIVEEVASIQAGQVKVFRLPPKR
jgi:hypothetical protein